MTDATWPRAIVLRPIRAETVAFFDNEEAGLESAAHSAGAIVSADLDVKLPSM